MLIKGDLALSPPSSFLPFPSMRKLPNRNESPNGNFTGSSEQTALVISVTSTFINTYFLLALCCSNIKLSNLCREIWYDSFGSSDNEQYSYHLLPIRAIRFQQSRLSMQVQQPCFSRYCLFLLRRMMNHARVPTTAVRKTAIMIIPTTLSLPFPPPPPEL
eukprot:TRINITY_DN49251_c0_g1_i1.p1 TRINITY_DN49251_c0_g1~~TRINITY_DN49251_c0_g1_i1.p1  ORF type:complete len:160 (+),score=11.30 TRINITY_DN49251_c0_g1_i1:41-520(+)